MKRKIFSLVLAICMLIPACVMLSACKEDKEHTHSFNENHVCVGCDIIEEGYTVKRSNKKTAVAYKTFEEAATALTDGDTLKLYDDLTMLSEGANNYVVMGSSEDENLKNYTIDFNGHTLTSKKGGIDLYANLTLRNGKLLAEGRNGIYAQHNCTLTIESNATIECVFDDPNNEADFAVVAIEGATINVFGTVKAVNGPALSGNGSSGQGDITCNIEKGAVVTSDTDVAIYMPNSKALNIKGGTITGTTALYIKSGTTTITGGTFNSTLETKAPYVHNGKGCDATGDTIIIEACGYPGGNPIVNISGGTFNKVAEGAFAVAYYTYEGNEASIAITVEGLALNK